MADKVCAARKRGLWTGATVPLGYDLVDKRLVVNQKEAERARILNLLIEEVRYDAAEGEVSITFRPGGVRSLAREDGRETA